MSNFNILSYFELPSTQDEAKRLIHEHRWQHGLVISAQHQTHAYGSRGRSWLDAPGNLAFSLILDLNQLPIHLDNSDANVDVDGGSRGGDKVHFSRSAHLFTVVYLACVALGETLLHHYPALPINYKWVNDVLLEEAKFAGTLVELIGTRALIIGMGVNLRSAPQLAGCNVTSLAAHGVLLEAPQLLDMFLNEFERILHNLQSYSSAAVHSLWLKHAWGVGKTCHFRDPLGGEFKATILGLAENGGLLIQRDEADGKAGEVITNATLLMP